MVYIVLALMLVGIWLPIRRPTYRWEQLIYGMPIIYVDRSTPEERMWRHLRWKWHQRDVT